MTIIDFYKELSKILTDRRENFISLIQAQEKLDTLLLKAQEFQLQVEIYPNILDMSNLMKLDDERSYEDSHWTNDSSYGEDYGDFTTETSY